MEREHSITADYEFKLNGGRWQKDRKRVQVGMQTRNLIMALLLANGGRFFPVHLLLFSNNNMQKDARNGNVAEIAIAPRALQELYQ